MKDSTVAKLTRQQFTASDMEMAILKARFREFERRWNKILSPEPVPLELLFK